MNKLTQNYLDSREVAEMVGKGHHKLLRDIRGYIEQLGESKIGFTDFFTESTYVTEQNKTMPCYMVTKKGCEFIAHKLTGIKGTEFTAKYINRFHDMEQQLVVKPMSTLELMELQFQAIKEVKADVESVNRDLQEFKRDMPLLALECQRITRAKNQKIVPLLGGKNSAAYNNSSLRKKVYTDIDTQIRRHFGVNTYKAIKRNQCDLVIELINQYTLPLVLEEQIESENAQMSFM
ncbi:MAG: ORF6C domain-containing protein [Bacteroidales bacterium]|nr:ORF6C domain-containing protein [Bacteroidales bacterium]